MRRVLTTTDESHPDVPAGLEHLSGEERYAAGPLVWQVYVDGTPFVGVPLPPMAGEHRRDQLGQAHGYAAQAIATGRYEYVDVRLVPDRRLSQRRHDNYPATYTPGWYGRRDSQVPDRRAS